MPTKTHFRTGLVQMAMSARPEENLEAACGKVREAAEAGAEVVCLPELYRSPYFCQKEDAALFDLAEPVPGPSTEALGRAAKGAGVAVVAPIFERRAAGLYHNTAVILDADGEVVGRYRKMHIPDDPLYYEKFYFTPGDLGFHPIHTSVGRLGVLVCWDQWYPEAARLMALAGAELLLYPTAIGWDNRDSSREQARQQDAWLTVQRGHAVANCLPVLICNRTGHEPDPSGQTDGIQFWGSSAVIGPQGEMLARASSDNAEVLMSTLDLDRSEQLRQMWPFLRDRRIDAYQDLQRRYRD
jgi:N-carbamoylputrescine amidase